MTFADVAENRFLIHLSLAKCAMRTMDDVTLPNLRSLDLSGNPTTRRQSGKLQLFYCIACAGFGGKSSDLDHAVGPPDQLQHSAPFDPAGRVQGEHTTAGSEHTTAVQGTTAA